MYQSDIEQLLFNWKKHQTLFLFTSQLPSVEKSRFNDDFQQKQQLQLLTNSKNSQINVKFRLKRNFLIFSNN